MKIKDRNKLIAQIKHMKFISTMINLLVMEDLDTVLPIYYPTLSKNLFLNFTTLLR